MMRSRILTTLFGLLFFLSFLAAKPVGEREAIDIAMAFIQSWHQPVDATIGRVEARYLPDGKKSYYIVRLEEKGWVLVSADDVIQPVLAFSFENNFAPEEVWSDATRYLLDGYSSQIGLAIKDSRLTKHPDWEQLKLPSVKKSANVIIEPFIDVTWNQGSGWNRFCPVDEDGPGGHAYVGCVAVSMAQAMTVYKFPVKPTGKNSYVHDTYGAIAVNYDNQSPYEWNQMSQTSSDDFNARLLYHCAVAVNMNFGPGGSGAYVRTASGALKAYFGYSETTKMVDRYEDEEQWKNLLIDELSQGRPIIYRGEPDDGTAGHAWNIDGYGDGYFHMNFGWSGSQNGYFTLNLINPGSYDFTANQGAIVGMRPPESAPYDIVLSATTVDEKLPVGSFVAVVDVADEDPLNTYTYACMGPYSIILDRRDSSKNFYIKNDTLRTREVLEYNSTDPTRNKKNILIKVKDKYNNVFEKEFNIMVQKVLNGPSVIALSDSSVLEGRPAGTAVAATLVEDDYENNSYQFTLYGPYNDAIVAYDPPSFYIDENDTLRTDVVFNYEECDSCFVRIELEDSHGNILASDFVIKILENVSGNTGFRKNEVFDASFYPNPADNFIFIPGVSEDLFEAEIFDMTGKMMISGRFNDQIDVSLLPEGIYIILMKSSSGIHTGKLVIQR